MSAFILIEAQLAERHWTSPAEAWRLQMCLAALQAAGDGADLPHIRAQLQQKVDTVNAGNPEPVTLLRLLCLAFDREVKAQQRTGYASTQMMQFGAILATELGLEADPDIRQSFQDIRHKAQHGW